MVTFRLTRKECYMLLSWIQSESEGSIAVGLPFQEAEITLVKKIRDAIKKQSSPNTQPSEPKSEGSQGLEGEVKKCICKTSHAKNIQGRCVKCGGVTSGKVD